MLIGIRRRLKWQKGQGLIEYGLILAAIIVGVIVLFRNIGTKVKSKVSDVNSEVAAL